MLMFDAFRCRNHLPTEHYSRTLKDRIHSLTAPAPMSEPRSRQKFPSENLRPQMRSLLASTLHGVHWDSSDRLRMSSLSKKICERVKQLMLEIEPRGFKYIVTSTFSENLGQAGRADMSCHWEETDCAVQEMYSNESMIFVCIAYAVRII